MIASFVNDERNMLKHASAMRRCSSRVRPSLTRLGEEHATMITAARLANNKV
jgi:hypothetical protein